MGAADPGDVDAGGVPGPAPAGWVAAPITAPTPTPPAPSTSGRTAPRRWVTVLVAGLTAGVVGVPAGWAGARLASAPATPAGQSAAATPVETPVAAVLDPAVVGPQVQRSVVSVRVTGDNGDEGSGSAIVLDADGHLLTNRHVIAVALDGGDITVGAVDGRRAEATLVGASQAYDLAVLSVDLDELGDNVAVAATGDSDDVGVGDPVLAVGAPLGLDGTVTTGIVSTVHRGMQVGAAEEGSDDPVPYINAIQTDAAINPGNSGGALVDAAGRVVGVNSAILTADDTRADAGSIGLGFAMPIDEALPVADELITDGKVRYPVIGAEAEATGDGVGVRLTSVQGKGPAAEAGLRRGDVVLSIDQVPLGRGVDLIVQVRRHRPGDVVTVEYRRDGATRQAQATLAGRVG